MEGFGGKWRILRSLVVIIWSFGLAAVFVSAERGLKKEGLNHNAADESETNYLLKVANFLWQSNESGYQHVWPVWFIDSFFFFFEFYQLCICHFLTLYSNVAY